jgi:hypothetical protein
LDAVSDGGLSAINNSITNADACKDAVQGSNKEAALEVLNSATQLVEMVGLFDYTGSWCCCVTIGN